MLFSQKLNNIKQKDLYIFDCDGTLVDSETLTNKIIASMLTEIEIPTTTEESLELFAGKKFKDIIAHISKAKPKYDNRQFEKDFRARCTIAFNTELKTVEGVEKLLDKISTHKAIASNGPRVKMDITLKVTDLNKYFPAEHIFSAYDIQKWKPEPGLFLNVLKYFDVSPNKALVIEDTISGVMGAINAGIDVVAINPYEDQEIIDTGIPSFKTMREIKDYLFPSIL